MTRQPTSQMNHVRKAAEQIVAERLSALGFAADGIPAVIRDELASKAEAEFAGISRKAVPDWATIAALLRKFKAADPSVAQKEREKKSG